jgi:uncharacterized membrane protein
VIEESRPILLVPGVNYDRFVDAMFLMIRQIGSGSTAALIRILDGLTGVVTVERNPSGSVRLQRYADLVLDDANWDIASPAGLDDIRLPHRGFVAMRERGSFAHLEAMSTA